MASIDDIVTVGNSTNKNISALIVAINNFANLYSVINGYVAPVTITTDYTVKSTDKWIIADGSANITLTLPSAASFTGYSFCVKNLADAFTVISNAANVVPFIGGAAGTAILAAPGAAAAKFAVLVSDGTNWVIMQAN